MRLDRPIGILLLLWPTLIALWLATNGKPSLHIVLIFCSGVIVMRSAGCVINDYADYNLDSHVSRTKNRPLASKQITPKSALNLFIALLIIAFVIALQLNLNTIVLAIIAVFLATIYPFMKRITGYPQLVLGIAFAWSVPMAYMQITGKLTLETWIVFASVVAWVIAYDTQYAMADKSDDLKIGIKSTAISFGNYDKFIIVSLQLLCLIGLSYVGVVKSFNYMFYLMLSLAVILIIYQQWLIKDRLPERCMAAFINNNYFGVLMFLGIVCG